MGSYRSRRRSLLEFHERKLNKQHKKCIKKFFHELFPSPQHRMEKLFLCNHFNEFNLFSLRMSLCVNVCLFILAHIKSEAIYVRHRHNCFMLWKKCASTFHQAKTQILILLVIKMLVDIVNFGVFNIMKVDNFASQFPHTQDIYEQERKRRRISYLLILLLIAKRKKSSPTHVN